MREPQAMAKTPTLSRNAQTLATPALANDKSKAKTPAGARAATFALSIEESARYHRIAAKLYLPG
jgi:hypothetical protein